MKPRTCNGCRALIVTNHRDCDLGFKVVRDGYQRRPDEPCPKPRTNAQLSEAFKIKRDAAQTKYVPEVKS